MKPLRLWIDALCINQTDAMERDLQVSCMADIFLRAKSVWIWLGESDELVERGLSTLFDLYNSYKSHTGAVLSPTQFLSTTLLVEEEVPYIKQFAAVDAIPYWRRGWTFQENMSPRRHICYGNRMIKFRSWRMLAGRYAQWRAKILPKCATLLFYSSIWPLVSWSELDFLHTLCHVQATFAPYALAENYLGGKLVERFGRIPDADEKIPHISLALSIFYPEDLHHIPKGRFFQTVFYRTSDPRDSVYAIRKFIPGLANAELDYGSIPEHVFSVATEALL